MQYLNEARRKLYTFVKCHPSKFNPKDRVSALIVINSIQRKLQLDPKSVTYQVVYNVLEEFKEIVKGFYDYLVNNREKIYLRCGLYERFFKQQTNIAVNAIDTLVKNAREVLQIEQAKEPGPDEMYKIIILHYFFFFIPFF